MTFAHDAFESAVTRYKFVLLISVLGTAFLTGIAVWCVRRCRRRFRRSRRFHVLTSNSAAGGASTEPWYIRQWMRDDREAFWERNRQHGLTTRADKVSPSV